MPVTSGKHKEKITITIDHSNLTRIDSAIAKGEFSNVSETINKAIAYFFENRDKLLGKEDVKEWLISEEGGIYLKKLIREVQKKE